MIKPKPFKLTCSDCGYSKIFAPRSDALLPHERPFSVCPKCQAAKIERTLVDSLTALLLK